MLRKNGRTKAKLPRYTSDAPSVTSAIATAIPSTSQAALAVPSTSQAAIRVPATSRNGTSIGGRIIKNAKLPQYNHEYLKLAIEEVQANNSSLCNASRKYGIPKSTLSKKARGINAVERKMGPKPILGLAAEEKIVEFLFMLADAGFPISKQQLLDNMKEFASKQTENPFKNGQPGETWFQLFCNRHPSIRMRFAQNLSRIRETVTAQNIREWFDRVQIFCEANNCIEALADPRRVFNLDESAFFLSPRIGRVLEKKGAEAVCNMTQNSDRQCTAVLMGGNAAGELAPSMVVVKAKIVPRNVFEHLPDNWGIGESKSVLRVNLIRI